VIGGVWMGLWRAMSFSWVVDFCWCGFSVLKQRYKRGWVRGYPGDTNKRCHTRWIFDWPYTDSVACWPCVAHPLTRQLGPALHVTDEAQKIFPTTTIEDISRIYGHLWELRDIFSITADYTELAFSKKRIVQLDLWDKSSCRWEAFETVVLWGMSGV